MYTESGSNLLHASWHQVKINVFRSFITVRDNIIYHSNQHSSPFRQYLSTFACLTDSYSALLYEITTRKENRFRAITIINFW